MTTRLGASAKKNYTATRSDADDMASACSSKAAKKVNSNGAQSWPLSKRIDCFRANTTRKISGLGNEEEAVSQKDDTFASPSSIPRVVKALLRESSSFYFSEGSCDPQIDHDSQTIFDLMVSLQHLPFFQQFDARKRALLCRKMDIASAKAGTRASFDYGSTRKSKYALYVILTGRVQLGKLCVPFGSGDTFGFRGVMRGFSSPTSSKRQPSGAASSKNGSLPGSASLAAEMKGELIVDVLSDSIIAKIPYNICEEVSEQPAFPNCRL